jgi:hypothetical protein
MANVLHSVSPQICLSVFFLVLSIELCGYEVTGCIRPSHLSRLNPNDAGGQYDSSGGAGGRGNPQGSICLGCDFMTFVNFNVWANLKDFVFSYKHYVELVEPAGPRACIKCCDDPADCPTNKGRSSVLSI